MDERDPLSEKVIGAAIEVHRILGPGLLESVYQKCLSYELTLRGIDHCKEVELPIVYKGASLDCNLFMDFVVCDELVIELKAVDKLQPIHEAQLLTYLKLSHIHRGLLINFNAQLLKDGLKRMVYNFSLSFSVFLTLCSLCLCGSLFMSQKTWGGRFAADTDKRVEAFTESITYDRRLYRHDVRASQAHARMLAAVGLLTADEAERICTSLDGIAARIERGDFTFSTALEDIHTHIERALIDELGDLGRKLHTARSRNDQVVTDVMLWVRDAIDSTDGMLLLLQRSFLDRAERYRELILPGYTHLQRAQPVLAAHYFLAYIEKFQRDRERLHDARKRANVLPLGAAALAGTSLPIDRDHVARQLGFDAVARNSLDISNDRDFMLEFVFDLAVIALHLSGWAEEWIIWATTEFNFLDLPDAFCTGSSIMPHKKNPDVLELIRGKAARAVGALNQLMMLVKGLPLAYNRDLQEDKPNLFDAYDTVSMSLELAAALVRETRFREEVIAGRIEEGFLDATTLMELLIARGLPMRSAHEAVGKLVRLGEERRQRLAELPAEAFDGVQPGLAKDVYKILGARNALTAFRSVGSTAPAEVDRQLADWRKRLATESAEPAA